MGDREIFAGKKEVSEELLGVKVDFTDGLVTGLQTADGQKTSVKYVRNGDRVKHRGGIPVVDELELADGTKYKRDGNSGNYLDAQGRTLSAPPMVHTPSMGDNEAFIRYCETNGTPHTVFASRGDVVGRSLPIDKGLLTELWQKNLPKIDRNYDKEIDLPELVQAIENPQFTGLDAVFLATLKRRFDLVSRVYNNYNGWDIISAEDIEKLDRTFQELRPGFTGTLYGAKQRLDTILESWIAFQNKSKFVDQQLYAHGPRASIKPEYVLQGDTGNCYWQASLMAVARVAPTMIEEMIKPMPDGNWQVLFPQKRWCNQYMTVKPLTDTEQLLYSGAAGGGQWAGILEKAMAQYRNHFANYFKTKPRTENQTLQEFSESGVQYEMLQLLTDKIVTVVNPQAGDLERLHVRLKKAMEQHSAMGVGMDKPPVKGVHGNHCYAILEYDAEKRLVTLYDPNHFFEPKDRNGVLRDGVRDGIFTLTLKEFKSCCDQFSYYDSERKLEMKQKLFVDSNIAMVDGKISQVNQEGAVALCQKLGVHLPTAREFALYMNPDGILEADYIEKELGGKVPDGYYKVACENDGVPDVFYFNNKQSRKLSGKVAKLSFWTSSKVLGNPKYAHVFYGHLGGGGGEKEDHEINRSHAVLFLPPSQK